MNQRDMIESLPPVDKVASADLEAEIKRRTELRDQCAGWYFPSMLTGQIERLQARLKERNAAPR